MLQNPTCRWSTCLALRTGNEAPGGGAGRPGARLVVADLVRADGAASVVDIHVTGHVQTMNASDFKARCLAILDRVARTGARLIILKRGRPVAEIRPPSPTDTAYPQQTLKGTVTVVGDVVGPAIPQEHWDCLRR